MSNNFYDRVASIVKEKGTNIYQLERASGLANGTISGYRDGGLPTLATVIKIAKALDVNTSVLVDGIDIE